MVNFEFTTPCKNPYLGPLDRKIWDTWADFRQGKQFAKENAKPHNKPRTQKDGPSLTNRIFNQTK